MPEDQAPPVVAVVVSSDPGPWFEDALVALTAQDYANLSILVIDAGSAVPIAERVAAVAPQVYLRRLEENRGYGPSANAVLGSVEGSTHFLFCHDDLVLSPDALRRMVEEAFRSNAGIITPKLVDFDEPDRILQLGLGVDRFGAPLRRVERGEFDQAQHDEVREVFAAPGACTLIRSDLFVALGGFDPEMSMFGEDVDLCWRARLAGARVLVVPSAVGRHREATSARFRPLPKARDLQWRHELRAVLKNYGRLRRAFVVSQLALLSLVEVVYFLLTNRRRRARQVIDAWRWNLAPQRHLKAARAQVSAARRLPDHVVCALFSRRTSRLWRFVRPVLERGALRWSRHDVLASARIDLEARPRRPREVSLAVGGLVLVLLFGSRSVIFGHLPLVGQYLPLPSPATLLGHFFGGSTDAGLQGPGPSSPALAMFGVAGIVLLGAMGLVQKVLVIALVVLGGVGMSRLMAPFGSRGARVGAATAYLFLPLAWNDIALGDVRGLVAFAISPYLLARLSRASALPPFVVSEQDDVLGPARVREVLSFGLVLACGVSFAPILVAVALVMTLSLSIGCVVSGSARAGRRVLGVGVAGTIMSVVFCLPWSLTYLQANTNLSVVTGPASAAARVPQLGALLRFDLGPLGRGLLGWAFLAGALFVLVAGTGDRLAWGMRIWAIFLGGAAFSWALSQGWIGNGGTVVSVALAPLAVAVAGLVGLGIAAVPADLRRAHFGLGHVAVVAFVICLAAGVLPVLGGTLPGRWGLADAGYDSVLSWMNPSGQGASGQRVLWLGDPGALAIGSWQISPGLALGVSEGGLGNIERNWPSPNPSLANGLAKDVVAAESGSTVKLGTSLASVGIRYVVVPSTFAPVLEDAVDVSPAPAPPPQALLDGLAAQSDFRELPEEGGALVFTNTAWHSLSHPVLGRQRFAIPTVLRSLGVGLELLLWLGASFYLVVTRPARRRRGPGSRHDHDDTDLDSLEPSEHDLGRYAALPQ